MSEINNIKQRFEELCKNPDFISAYNDFNGTSLASLSLSQLFSVGTLFHFVSIKTHDTKNHSLQTLTLMFNIKERLILPLVILRTLVPFKKVKRLITLV